MMEKPLPAPLKRSGETVTFRRADWDVILDHIEQLEDTVAVLRAPSPASRGQGGLQMGDYLTSEELRRLLNWENPVKLWREKRGLSQRGLSTAAGVSPSYLAEIEGDRKPGSAEALYRLSRKLKVPMELLMPNNRMERIAYYVEGIVEEGESRETVIDAARMALAEAANLGREPRYRASFDEFLANLSDHWRDRVRQYADEGHLDAAEKLDAVLQDCFENDGIVRLARHVAVAG